ncbi:BMP family ABC transporter substrate-binding protein [Nocardioides humilatus]|uniref:BMP family ABC transporter substrate-binding protein n=1 Tax=Nocardioides humilatus TaxID=2607660 RepID=A0A5B1LMY4_9ACTN|nr:BMP family ABC transporter substrate-binding protein [Nocardioides humilatus]KAA1421160.1 BMP family ABC transporter substrate-binding protein [Nocardioides humilatus]
MKKTARIAAVGVIAALALTACGDREDDKKGDDTKSSSAPTDVSSSPTDALDQYPDFKACMVSDSGGFDDKSFNQTSHDGLTNAVADYGVQSAEVESNDPSQFADNIQSMVDEGCNSITTVGFLLADDTIASATENPDIDYSIVDFAYFDDKGNNTAPANLKGLTFNTGQPSFLAGYLAAAKTQSGVVGTFGGLNIPTVTIFMDGFAQGVDYYNEENGTDVAVLGWDREKKDGSFTEDFESTTKGQNVAEELISQGADIIFPVAGPAGLGGLQAAKDNGAWGIWVDTDGCVSASEYCDILLTSVMKGMDVAVEQGIADAAAGTFSNEPYSGTLENGGVDLAPFGPNADIDDDLSATIDDLKQQIIDGTIEVGAP